MTYLILIFISFSASVIGSICGIGGGVIIKPVIDSLGIFSAATVSFLSGCIVLSMAAYSVVCSKLSGSCHIDQSRSGWLGLGAAMGGLSGKKLLDLIEGITAGADRIGAVQAAVLFAVTFATVIYTLNKEKIHSKEVKSPVLCSLIGLALGMLSSFLGIGGGPINLVVLYYFFSMDTKCAAQNSLYIIFISQLISLLFSFATGEIPKLPLLLYMLMVCCGILGGAVGRKINKQISEKNVNKLFIALLCIIMIICCYNFCRFYGLSL